MSISSRCFHVTYFTEMLAEKVLKWHEKAIMKYSVSSQMLLINNITTSQNLHKQPRAQTSNELCMV